MSYIVASAHQEAPITLAAGRAHSVFFDLTAKTLTINEKGPIPVSLVGYQALYGLTLPPHITLTPEEINAARECIHATCRYPLISELPQPLIPGSLMDDELPMDFFVLSKNPLDGDSAPLPFGVHDYPEVDGLKIILAPMPAKTAPSAASEGIDMIRSLPQAIEKYGSEDQFLIALAQMVIRNYPAFCKDWGHEDEDQAAPSEDLKTQLKTILTSGAQTAFAFEANKLVGIMLDHGTEEGVHFPHFTIVDQEVARRGIARLLASELMEESAISIAITKNPSVIQAAEKLIAAHAATAPSTDIHIYLYSINAPSEELAISAEASSTPSNPSSPRAGSPSLVVYGGGGGGGQGGPEDPVNIGDHDQVYS